MKSTILIAALLAGVVIAKPTTRLNARQRLAKRSPGRKSATNIKPQLHQLEGTEASDDWYNENWAGGVVTGSGYTGVSATFVLPTPEIPTAGGETSASEFTASTWIGLDGYDCDNLWQAGVDGTIEKSSGDVSWYAWYEWYPAGTVVLSLGTIVAGDTISVDITTSGYNTGTVTMENVSTGKTVSKTVTSSDTLCGTSAEWIEEDLAVDTTEIGLADYGSVTFTNAVATANGKTVTPAGAQLVDIEDMADVILTQSSVTSSSVTVEYIGE